MRISALKMGIWGVLLFQDEVRTIFTVLKLKGILIANGSFQLKCNFFYSFCGVLGTQVEVSAINV